MDSSEQVGKTSLIRNTSGGYREGPGPLFARNLASILVKLKILGPKYVNFSLSRGILPLSGAGFPFRNFCIHHCLYEKTV
jgi:hypothetical protein